MNSKKKLILSAARFLFNEKGYHQVTIRLIAMKLNMSSGNLNYHYKKREDIFEALYFEMVSEFDERINGLPAAEFTIQKVQQDIRQSMQRMVAYRFFWTDLYNLLWVSHKVQNHFQEVYNQRMAGCLVLFSQLHERGLMKAASFEQEHTFLAQRMVDYGNTWLYASRLYQEPLHSDKIDYHVNTFLSMLYPYLTNLGKTEFRNVLPFLFGAELR